MRYQEKGVIEVAPLAYMRGRTLDNSYIILDEAHHSSAATYQKVMNYFNPALWLGMTATPDKRDDNIEGRNIYEIFNYQIAYEIRLQQAMEEDLLCPFHYFGITDLSIIGDNERKYVVSFSLFWD